MIPKEIPLRDEALFRLAMRHRSAAADSVRDSYERLEFFGDSVLGLVISQYLYENHPDWDQGVMSKARSSVVQEAPLAEAALALGLDQELELAASEEASGGRRRPGTLCDIFEAVVGAIYLESGLEKARWFILERLQGQLALIDSGDVSPMDFKSKLQEVSQSIWRKTPIYRIRVEDGQRHERRFTVEATLDSEVLGIGSGRSKKDAEQAAAQDALDIIARAQRARQETHRPAY
jgi:ribonuclease-3